VSITSHFCLRPPRLHRTVHKLRDALHDHLKPHLHRAVAGDRFETRQRHADTRGAVLRQKGVALGPDIDDLAVADRDVEAEELEVGHEASVEESVVLRVG